MAGYSDTTRAADTSASYPHTTNADAACATTACASHGGEEAA